MNKKSAAIDPPRQGIVHKVVVDFRQVAPNGGDQAIALGHHILFYCGRVAGRGRSSKVAAGVPGHWASHRHTLHGMNDGRKI